MTSLLGSVAAFTTLFSSARIRNLALLGEPRQQPSHSSHSNRSSAHCSSAFLSLRPLFSPFPLRSSRWNPPAAEAEDVTPVEEYPAPDPVEAQIEAAAASSTRKGEDVFAVVMIGSRQYIVIPGRFIYTQRLKGANVNDKFANDLKMLKNLHALLNMRLEPTVFYNILSLTSRLDARPPRFGAGCHSWSTHAGPRVILSKVLLVGTPKKAYIGQPVVTNAVVHAVVEEQGLDKKVIVFKYKKKKNYRRNIGHRQPNTRIRITGISGYEDYPADTMPEPEAVAA